MKNIYYVLMLLAVFALGSCEMDNYDEPESFFTGRITYNGNPIGVDQRQVRFQLWEPGFGVLTPINVPVDQDGSFSARLFDGDYKLKFIDGQGPFRTIVQNEQQLDTLFVNLRGDMSLDVEVMPYYIFNNIQISNSGTTVSASCGLEQIITGENAKNVERVTLYINKTLFVGDGPAYSIARADADISDLNNISTSLEIPELSPSQNYVYARIGVKMVDVEYLLFSPVEKISF